MSHLFTWRDRLPFLISILSSPHVVMTKKQLHENNEKLRNNHRNLTLIQDEVITLFPWKTLMLLFSVRVKHF